MGGSGRCCHPRHSAPHGTGPVASSPGRGHPLPSRPTPRSQAARRLRRLGRAQGGPGSGGEPHGPSEQREAGIAKPSLSQRAHFPVPPQRGHPQPLAPALGLVPQQPLPSPRRSPGSWPPSGPWSEWAACPIPLSRASEAPCLPPLPEESLSCTLRTGALPSGRGLGWGPGGHAERVAAVSGRRRGNFWK